MLKKRAEVAHASRGRRLMCSRLDRVSEALTNDRARAAARSEKAHAMLASVKGSAVNCKLNCPAWRKPHAEVLLEIGS
jgi:hypothetical protein